MKHLRAIALTIASLCFVPAVFAQAEHLKTIDGASVVVTAGQPSPFENISNREHIVTIDARHCQEYATKAHWYSHKSVITAADYERCAADPSTLFYTHSSHNLRTNAGGDWQASVMANTSAPPATCNYIALSNDATAPSTSDTSVASEIAANGLSRAQGTYAHTTGTSSLTVQKVFSATGTQASQKAGLLNASSSGTLCFENTYTQVTVNNGDTLTVTWTINY